MSFDSRQDTFANGPVLAEAMEFIQGPGRSNADEARAMLCCLFGLGYRAAEYDNGLRDEAVDTVASIVLDKLEQLTDGFVLPSTEAGQ